jgi:phosphoribosylglycinamide formyltransferase-1
VSSRPDAYGLTRARRSGVETLVLDKKINWQKLLADLRERHISHIFLTGFMKIVAKEFLREWQKPILNVHPSLLPLYPGLKSVERAMRDQADLGVTVHKVIADVDAGETVEQKTVLKFSDYSKMTMEQIEFAMHLTEYELVRKSFKVASCWT